MKDHADKLKESDKDPLEKAIQKVRSAAKGDQVDAIKSAVSELEQAQQALSKMMYEAEKNKPADAPAGAKASGPADDEAIDAEFEVKKD